MKLSLNHQGIKKSNSKNCVMVEHKLDHPMLDFALATISGRYPEEKRAVNLECAELAYVSEGYGKIVINDIEHLLNAGDVLIIEAGEKYYWEGNMKLFVSCRPAWKKEQHQMVD